MRILKFTTSFLLLLLMSYSSWAQRDISFFHMGPLTPRSSEFNASYFPDARVYVSFPGSMHLNFHNAITYNDLFKLDSDSDSLDWDIEGALDAMGDGATLNVNGSISFFQLGMRFGENVTFSAFGNIRYDLQANYPNDMLRYLTQGNGDFLGEDVVEEDLHFYGVGYREIGAGLTYQFNIGTTQKLRVGVRGKVLNGLFYGETNSDATTTFTTSEDRWGLNIQLDNASMRTVGSELGDEEEPAQYFINNNNKGVAFDIGFEYDLNERLSIGLGINDIGSINWKEQVKNYALVNSEISFQGIDLRDLDNLSTMMEDSVDRWFQTEEDSEPFTTSLATRSVVSASYQVAKRSTIMASFLHDSKLGMEGATYGVGFTQGVGKILTLSMTGRRAPAGDLAIGGGFGARLGVLQLYTVVDNVDNVIISQDIRDFKDMNLRFGVNLLFGRREKRSKKDVLNSGRETQENVQPGRTKFRTGGRVTPFPPGYDLEDGSEEESE